MNVLVIAYYFPPMGGAGVQRTLKFVKYLRRLSCNINVVAGQEQGYVVDASLRNEVPSDVNVIRIDHFPLIQRIRHTVLSISSSGETKSESNIRADSLLGTYLKDSMLRAITTLSFPDDKAKWAKKAYFEASKIIENQNIDVIFSTSAPISAHFLAKRLKHKYDIPWVSDFRDLWTGNPEYNMPWLRRVLDEYFERKLLRESNAIVTVTNGLCDDLRKLSDPSKNIYFIPNGYDEEDFEGLVVPSQNRNSNQFVITFTGTCYGDRTPVPFLNGLSIAFRDNPELSEKIRVRFVGNIGTRFLSSIHDFSKSHKNVIELIGYKPHTQAIIEMLSSDALLLFIGGGKKNKGVLTGKVFEYLRARKPILFIGPTDGEVAELLRQFPGNIIVDESDIDAIAIAIKNILYSNNISQNYFPYIDKYSRKNLTQKLLSAFKQVI